jgi:hypothetical protein
MSSDTWTRCAGDSRVRPLRAEPWRAVESQHVVSTRKLVDSDDEQRVLEELLDASKPPVPESAEGLHYLLSTPLRYPPLRWGSRFGTRAERGIFYASVERRTCCAEVAYYRLLFLAGTTADLGPLLVELTLFRCRIRALRGVDLGRGPFAACRDAIASPTSYAATHPLGAAMRAASVAAFLFPSARDPEGGANVGVFDPVAFAHPRPVAIERWLCTARPEAVELVRVDPLAEREVFRFDRSVFLVDGALATVAGA